MLLGIAGLTRGHNVAQGMRATVAQGLHVILSKMRLRAFATIGAAMVKGDLESDPLGMSKIVDGGVGFQCSRALA